MSNIGDTPSTLDTFERGRSLWQDAFAVAPSGEPHAESAADSDEWQTRRSGALERIFVCFGGFDAAGQTLRALDAQYRGEVAEQEARKRDEDFMPSSRPAGG